MTMLLGSSYTPDYLIKRCFPDVDKIEERARYEILNLENAKSFWSRIAIIELHWIREEDRKRYPDSIFVKVPSITTITLGVSDGTLENFTSNEETFYRTMQNSVISGFPYPHYYHGEKVGEVLAREGCLVLEDFSGKVASVDYIPGFTIPQVESLIDAIASWHAHVFDRPEMTKAFHQCNPYDANNLNCFFNKCLQLELIRPDWFRDRIRPLQQHFTTGYAWEAMASYNELDIPPVVVHTDMNTTNVLWKKETIASEKPEIVSIIDFQQVHIGNICEDIARILQLGVSVDMRRSHEDRLLTRYHQKLGDILGNRNPVSLKQVRSAYRRIFPLVSSFSLFAIVCYYSMYNASEKDENTRAAELNELLERAKGIVDDVYVIEHK